MNGRATPLAQRESTLTYRKLVTCQLRALFHKSVAFQRRQVFVNVCCISLCPIMMVVVAGILGFVLTNLINSLIVVQEVVYCSNYNGTFTLGLPLADRSSLPLDSLGRKISNYFIAPSDSGMGRPLGSTTSSCANWFENYYPYKYPYEKNPNAANPLFLRDLSFRPDPPFGWFGLPVYNLTLPAVQTFPWFLYNEPTDGVMGNKLQNSPINYPIVNASLVPSEGNEPNKTGFLGNFPTYFFMDKKDDNSYVLQRLPFFIKPETTINTYYSNKINDLLEQIALLNKTIFQNFVTKVDKITRQMPQGAFIFNNFDASNNQYAYTLQTGSDKRITRSTKYPSEGFRRLMQQSWLANAIAKTYMPNANISINHGLRTMPVVINNRFDARPIYRVLGNILFPFGVSFLLPVFVLTLVKEKEDRILIMMQMNGLRTWTYYLMHYAFFYLMHFLASTVFIIAGVVARLDFFVKTDPGVYILLFFLWGHVQIIIAFLLSCFFNKSRNALIVSFLIVIASVLINIVAGTLFTDKPPLPYLFWAPFAFYRSINRIALASSSDSMPPYSMSKVIPGDEVSNAMIALVVEIFVYALLASYLSAVLPSEYGVRKKWYFPISIIGKLLFGEKESNQDDYNWDVNDADIEKEDDDVKMERERVHSDHYNANCPLVLKNLRKVYPNGKIAVKTATYAVDPSSCFGLLGPNGSGKTTTISILSGLYKPTSGFATLAGYSVLSQMDDVYRNMGVCPQHDILWDDLTVGEHLYFYARLKGVEKEKEKDAVQKALKSVSLGSFEDRQSKGLSGGEKRRLSIAIALIGGGKVVFLDEPTTGLDPEVRRIIWNIINEAKIGRTIILTTHSMEEAEVLCNRIGIMAKGTLRCIGSLLHLKKKYGSGFKLTISATHENMYKATTIDSFATNTSYEFSVEKGLIPRLFKEIEFNKHNHGIEDWGLSQTTLEEVFLRIIGDTDAEAEG
ncbi:hypothetical protein ROZALSC1DRAFT_28441 [Rozella allomycis CSF55]|uniref:ABC transporter domain-containing protein n=1 Tax=Rozella allomycis (strain CSF55) TaxID=988480 RepID=A0A4P9YKP8_ROZAC|nr:hypothetical protein ROZALSC1DRAFT_28441 [Rozella allomycis CSF55]